MKKKIFLVISAMLVFGLAVAVYSFGTTSDLSATAAACCCCHGDSCPMKTKDASGKEVASTHEDCDCCKDGANSCPMMKKDADGKPMKMDAASCPMMKKDADGKPMKMDDAAAMPGMQMKHDMKMDGKGCPCCHKAKDKEKTPAPAV